MGKDLRIVFMGTPEFAVHSLNAILDAGFEVAAVVTAPDKPAGRGRSLRIPEVKAAALEKGLPILQPVSLKDPVFLDALRSYQANLQVVVAFRMLPEIVWNMPEFGTINVHASLLPQYRGAAPINHAIINGERETGVTTFFLTHEIDTGNIILQHRVPVLDSDDAGSLHDKLAQAGGDLLVKTLERIREGNMQTLAQETFIPPDVPLKKAPKIFKPDCRINWNQAAADIQNLIRGLSPVPSAYTIIRNQEGISLTLKLFKASISPSLGSEPGSIISDGKTYLGIQTLSDTLLLEELQLEGKKRMNAVEFLRGFRIGSGWKICSESLD